MHRSRMWSWGWPLLTVAALPGLAPTGAVPNLAAPNQQHLPLGDGQVSDAPARGKVFACPFPRVPIGAFRDGPWIQGDRWTPDQKPAVDGAVHWPNAAVNIAVRGDRRLITANNLPTHPTGVFPISPTDDAYAFDRNPNPIRAQRILLDLPARPTLAARPSCLPMGLIGFTLSGAALYSALDARGRDAPAHELQDACDGHPEVSGQYHYHDLSRCARTGPGGLIGYALDGSGIYVPATETQNADLDACHGRVSEVPWDGRRVRMYHYVVTREYPYTLGCFMGTPIMTARPAPPPRP